MDIQFSMPSSRIAGRQALGNFFRAMQPERAHWYSIIMSNQVTGCDNNNHYSVFPPLSKLSSIQEDILKQVLVHCGLAMFWKNVGFSPLLKEWQYFITEQDSICGTRVLTLQRTPTDKWAAAQANALCVPRVCITLIGEDWLEKLVP